MYQVHVAPPMLTFETLSIEVTPVLLFSVSYLRLEQNYIEAELLFKVAYLSKLFAMAMPNACRKHYLCIGGGQFLTSSYRAWSGLLEEESPRSLKGILDCP